VQLDNFVAESSKRPRESRALRDAYQTTHPMELVVWGGESELELATRINPTVNFQGPRAAAAGLFRISTALGGPVRSQEEHGLAAAEAVEGAHRRTVTRDSVLGSRQRN
jgi:hypothetical protein